MRLADHLSSSRVLKLAGRTKREVLTELVDAASASSEVADRDALLQAILDREGILSTGIGLGIAVPHAKLASVGEFIIALGVSPEGIDFDALDQQPAHIVVLIAAPEGRQRDYLGLLAQITVTLKDAEIRRRIIDAADDVDQAHRILVSAVSRRTS